MPTEERVSRETVKPQVIAALSLAAEPAEPIQEPDLLLEDLGMGSSFRAAMALPYTKISEKYGGYPVLISEAESLKTVKCSIDLVYRKANRRNQP